MVTVYANVYTVVGADKSLDLRTGFLDAVPGGYHGEGKLVAAVDSENSVIYAWMMDFYNNPCSIFHNKPPEPLLMRVWIM